MKKRILDNFLSVGLSAIIIVAVFSLPVLGSKLYEAKKELREYKQYFERERKEVWRLEDRLNKEQSKCPACAECDAWWGVNEVIKEMQKRGREIDATRGLDVHNYQVRCYGIITYSGPIGTMAHEKVSLPNDSFACLNCEEYYKEKE